MANNTVVEPAAAASHPPKKARTDDLPAAEAALNAALAAATKANPPAPKEVRRVDYAPLPYKVTKVSLDFQLFERRTVVNSVLTVEKNDAAAAADTASDAKRTNNDDAEDDGLVLDGEEGAVALLALSVDGCDALIPDEEYILKPGKLIIKAETLHRGASNSNGKMIVRTTVEIVPEDNTQLSGLYNDGTMYCTQCEAEGFRRITYYPDRYVKCTHSLVLPIYILLLWIGYILM
jgi:aminopeptidase N